MQKLSNGIWGKSCDPSDRAGNCSIFSRLFSKTLFNLDPCFARLTSQSGSGFLRLIFQVAVCGPIFLTYPSVFLVVFLCGCHESTQLGHCPADFAVFNLSYSTSCRDLLLTLNKSRWPFWCPFAFRTPVSFLPFFNGAEWTSNVRVVIFLLPVLVSVIFFIGYYTGKKFW